MPGEARRFAARAGLLWVYDGTGKEAELTAAQGTRAAGTVKLKVAPKPCWLSAQMRPP